MIRFACPACQSVLRCGDSKAGAKVACPQCGQRLQVPACPPAAQRARQKTVLGRLVDLTRPRRASGSPAADSGVRSQPPPVRTARPAPPPSASFAVYCPGCGREIALPIDELGALIECARCATRFVTPAAPAELPSPGGAGDALGGGYRRHSGVGMASFIIALLVGGLDVVLAVVTASNMAHSQSQQQLTSTAAFGGMSLYCLNCMSLPLCLVGVGLAVVGLVGQRDRNHLFSWIGILGNGIVILAVVGVYVYATMGR